jgi:hypothetical protein
MAVQRSNSRRLCREALADHSEYRARIAITGCQRAISASGEIRAAADGCAFGSTGAGAGYGEALVRGSSADGDSTIEFAAERNVTFGAGGEAGSRFRPFFDANGSGSAGLALTLVSRTTTPRQIGPTPP